MASAFSDTITKPIREKGKVTNYAELQKYYSFFLWDLKTQEVIGDGRLDPAGQRPTAEYFFTISPQSIEVTEPFTTKVVSTQNGGKFVESHGSIYKMISVQGTTGLRPRKGLPNEIPLLSTSSFETLIDPGALRATLDEKEVTGIDDIHFMRNIFRLYSDLKHLGRKVIMIWRNAKDDDYWVVEPTEFKLNRDKSSPMTYKYSMSFKGISPFSATLNIPNDPLSITETISALSARVQGYQQALSSSFMVIATNINRIKAAGYTTIDLVTGPVISVLKGLAAINNASTGVVKGLRTAIIEGEARVLEAVEVLQASLEPDLGGTVATRSEIVRAFRVLVRTFARMRSENFAKGTVAGVAGSGLLNAFTDPTLGRRETQAGRRNLPTRVREGTVHRGETIGNIALRLLGSSSRWHEIALLNGLSSPYVSDSATLVPGVLAPGDTFLYPVEADGSDPSTLSPVNPSGNQLDTNFSKSAVGEVATQAFGRDIRLVTSSDGELTDFAVDQNGDLGSIVGTANVEQAIKIKFITEQGTLLMHPRFGAKFAIGTKADPSAFNTFRLNVVATLKSDPRISEVSYLRFYTDGDALIMEATVKLNKTNDYVSTNFALRRF